MTLDGFSSRHGDRMIVTRVRSSAFLNVNEPERRSGGNQLFPHDGCDAVPRPVTFPVTVRDDEQPARCEDTFDFVKHRRHVVPKVEGVNAEDAVELRVRKRERPEIAFDDIGSPGLHVRSISSERRADDGRGTVEPGHMYVIIATQHLCQRVAGPATDVEDAVVWLNLKLLNRPIDFDPVLPDHLLTDIRADDAAWVLILTVNPCLETFLDH